MTSHPLVPFDKGLIDDIAAKLDLRTPNAEALEAVAEHIATAAGSSVEVVCDLATAVGKTYLAAGLIDYFAHQGVRNILIVTPGRTILDKTINNFTPGHPKSVLDGMETVPRVVTGDNFNSGGVASALADEDEVKVFVFSVQSLIRPNNTTRRRVRKFQEWLGDDLYAYLRDRSDLLIISDEHHVYSENAAAFSAAIRELDPLALVGLTATPDRSDADKVIYHYPLARAIADRYVKTPVLVGRTDHAVGREIQLRDGLALLAAKQKAADAYADATGKPRVNAVMFVVADSIDAANEVSQVLRRPGLYADDYEDRVLTIHSRAADDALLRLAAVENPDSKVRVIVSVEMLKEGWDVKNIFVICSFRPSISDTLTEQTLGRGLRLPWGAYTDIELLDTVEVLSHERYELLLQRAGVLLEGLVQTRAVVKPTSIPGVAVVTDEPAPAVTPPSAAPAVAGDAARIAPVVEAPAAPSATDAPGGQPAESADDFLVSPSEQTAGTTLIVTQEERQREADEQAANAPQPVPARRTLQLATVERHLDPKPPLNLSDISDDQFAGLGREIASVGGAHLARKRLDVRQDSNSPTGLVLVPVDATDIIDAAVMTLPLGDTVRTLKTGLLACDFVSATSRSDLNAAKRLAEALLRGAGGEEHVGPYINQVIAVAQKALLVQHRAAPQNERLEVVAIDFAPARINTRKVELNRFGKFSKLSAYASWSERALHELNWFDTEPERRLANLLDGADAARVGCWARIQRGEFVILWQGGRYTPDFYAMIDGTHYLIEVKGDDRKDADEVQAKKAAAEKWARHVTDDGRHGTWRYLFVPQSVLAGVRTLDDLLNHAAR